MIEIDGREGGGQLLRTAVSLAAVLGKEIKVTNIRGARKEGGLKEQHLEGIRAVAELCNGELKGAFIGSTAVEFKPGKITKNELNVKIDTAGSIGLLFETLKVAGAFGKNDLVVNVDGGATAGKWAPPIEYLKNVFLPIAKKFGYEAEFLVERDGFYPKGGAKAEIRIKRVKELKAVRLTERGKFCCVKGVSICSKSLNGVAERQAESAKRYLKSKGIDAEISVKNVDAVGFGSVIVLRAEYENTVLGSDCIGERGVSAEEIGKTAAEKLVGEINGGGCLDEHASDQVLVLMALAKGVSRISFNKVTEHCRTNISVLEKMLGVKFKIEENAVEVEGIGLANAL